MKTTLKQNLVWLRNYLVYRKFDVLAKIRQSKFRTDSKAQFVVSIASYPQRSSLIPAVFQALNHQTTIPQKWLLVLSEEEWPNKILPHYLRKLESRGIEIIWVKGNTYAVKKLVPVIERYPNLGVITFDDELIYGKYVIEKLIKSSLQNKGSIVGHVGKKLIQKNGELKMMHRDETDADLDTPSCQIYFLGGSGTFYPAGSLNAKVLDLEAITKIVPGRGSDIWFWAAAVANKTKQICLGSKKDRSLYFTIPLSKKNAPKDIPGADVMEHRFQMAIDFFDIRSQLLSNLPNRI